MPEAIFDITADVTHNNRSCRVTAKQFDSKSRYLKVHITNRGRAVIVPQGCTVLINVKRPDNTAKAFSGSVNPDGTVKVPLNSWALELEGELCCDVSIIGTDGDKLTTTSFNVTVERSTYSGDDISQEPESMDIIAEVFASLNEAKNKMPNYIIGPGLKVSGNTLYVTAGIGEGGTSISVDPTLTVEGLAADAKATGEAIKKMTSLDGIKGDLYENVGIGTSDFSKYSTDVYSADELSYQPPVDPVDPEIPLKLTNSWDFTSGSMTDSIAGFTAVSTGCTLDSSGLTVGKADARCALGYGLITPGSAIEIDVASAEGKMEAGKHGRCFMFYENPDAGAIAAGLVYRHQTGNWAFYFGNWGNDLSNDKNLFNGKTVRLEMDDNGYFSMYVGGALVGKSNVSWQAIYSGFAIGGYADSFYNITVSAVRIYRKEQ